MLTYNCENVTQSWFTAPVATVTGVIVGALIGIGTAYLNQHLSHKYSLKLEDKKNRQKFLTEFFMKDIIIFIDQEVAYLQALYTHSASSKAAMPTGEHKNKIATVIASLKMFEDPVLDDAFTSLIRKNNIFETAIRQMETREKLTVDTYDVLNEVQILAGKLKKHLLEKSHF